MASTKELRRRIKSVKNTSQITKAMQMVAATKMRRAQNQALSGRPYNEVLSNTIAKLVPNIDPSLHFLLSGNSVATPGILLISTNKALCGALNTNLFRATQSFVADSHLAAGKIKYFSVGLKGRNFIDKAAETLEGDFENTEAVMFSRAKKIANLLINLYQEKIIGDIYLSYPHFASTLRQEPKIVKLLPIELGTKAQDSESSEFKFEPNADQLLDFTLTHHIETQIYQALLEAKASEHSARMMAMQNATDNALELVGTLSLKYNQTRQAAITSELLEITSAQIALE